MLLTRLREGLRRTGLRTNRTQVLAIGAAAATFAAAVVVVAVAVVDDGDSDCPIVSRAEMNETVTNAVGWMDRALEADGSFWYEYDRVADTFADDYHYVRHAGALMSLYQVAAAGSDAAERALIVGDGGLAFVTERLAESGDRVAFRQTGRSAILGSAALTIVALVHRRQATGDDRYDELLRGLGRFMQSLERGDGAMWARADGVDLTPAVGVTSTFYTGEAFWAYGLLADTFAGEGWEDSAIAVGRYIATERDAEEEIEDPPLADQWAAYGFSQLGPRRALEGQELDYVRSLVDRYHGRLVKEIGREADRVGDGSGPPDESVVQARGAGFGTTVEALAALWRLSLVDDGLRDLEERLRTDLVCGASILVARQVDAERAAEWPQPEIVEGAWFDEDVTRVDDQQHAVSGVLQAIPALEGS